MKIHKPGTTIKIKISGQTAMITEIIIGDTYIFYKVTYFINGDLKTPSLAEFEFDVLEGNKKIIGFK